MTHAHSHEIQELCLFCRAVHTHLWMQPFPEWFSVGFNTTVTFFSRVSKGFEIRIQVVRVGIKEDLWKSISLELWLLVTADRYGSGELLKSMNDASSSFFLSCRIQTPEWTKRCCLFFIFFSLPSSVSDRITHICYLFVWFKPSSRGHQKDNSVTDLIGTPGNLMYGSSSQPFPRPPKFTRFHICFYRSRKCA